MQHYMLTELNKFLMGQLDLSNLDVNMSGNAYSNLTIIRCNLNWTLDDYKVAFDSVTTDGVLIFFGDHYWYDDLSNTGSRYKFNKVSISMLDIISTAKQFSAIKITLLTVNYYTQSELSPSLQLPDNLTIVTTHGQFYTEEKYLTQSGVTKTFENDQHVLCLNNNPRPHRVGAVLYLTHLGLDKNVITSFMSAKRWDENVSWDTETILSFLYPNSKLYAQLNSICLESKYKHNAQSYLIYSIDTTNPVITNFNKLLPYYESTVVDIVTETTSLESTATLTEKYVHCVIGRCFPIIIGTFKNVELYRELGFDMFDDIIDHSYDYEPNPFYRIKMAIDLNMEIITNKEIAMKLYYDNQHRLDANIETYRKQYNIILADTIGTLDGVL